MIEMQEIGVIHTPYTSLEGMPIQPAGAGSICGRVEIFDQFKGGLKDLDGFSHIILIYFFHQSHGYNLDIVPFLDKSPRGLFSTRAPARPNPIGMSVVSLDEVSDGMLLVRGADILDGTPLLDIKPYVPEFDVRERVKAGWLDNVEVNARSARSDSRFVNYEL